MAMRRLHRGLLALSCQPGADQELLRLGVRLGVPDAWHRQEARPLSFECRQQGRLASTPVFLRQLSSRAEPSKDASRPHNGDTKFLAALRACSAQPGLNIADNVDTYFPTSRHDAAAAEAAWAALKQRLRSKDPSVRTPLTDEILVALSTVPLARHVPPRAVECLLAVIQHLPDAQPSLPAAIAHVLKRTGLHQVREGAFKTHTRQLAERVHAIAHLFPPQEAATVLRTLLAHHPYAQQSIAALADRLVALRACETVPMSEVVWTAHSCVKGQLTHHSLWSQAVQAMRQRTNEIPKNDLALAVKCVSGAPGSHSELLSAVHHEIVVRGRWPRAPQESANMAWDAPRTQQATSQDLVRTSMQQMQQHHYERSTLAQLSSVTYAAGMQRCLTPEFASFVCQRIVCATPSAMADVSPSEKVRLLWGLSHAPAAHIDDAAVRRLAACAQLHAAAGEMSCHNACMALEALARLDHHNPAVTSSLLSVVATATGVTPGHSPSPLPSPHAETDSVQGLGRGPDVASSMSQRASACAAVAAAGQPAQLKHVQVATLLRSVTDLHHTDDSDLVNTLVQHTLQAGSLDQPKAVYHVAALLRAAGRYPGLSSDTWGQLLVALHHVSTRCADQWQAIDIMHCLEGLVGGCRRLEGAVLPSQHLALHAFLSVVSQRLHELGSSEVVRASQLLMELKHPLPTRVHEGLLNKVMRHAELLQLPPGQLAPLLLGWLRHTRAPAGAAAALSGLLPRLPAEAAVLVAWGCAHALDPCESQVTLQVVVAHCRKLVQTALSNSTKPTLQSSQYTDSDPTNDTLTAALTLRASARGQTRTLGATLFGEQGGPEQDTSVKHGSLQGSGEGEVSSQGRSGVRWLSPEAVAQLVCVGARCAGRVPGARELLDEVRALTADVPTVLEDAAPQVRVLVFRVLDAAMVAAAGR